MKAKTSILNLLATKTTEHADTDPFVDDCATKCFPSVNYDKYYDIAPSIDQFILMLGSFIEEVMLTHHFIVIQSICNKCSNTNQAILENYFSVLEDFGCSIFNCNIDNGQALRNVKFQNKTIKTLLISRKEEFIIKIKSIINKIFTNMKKTNIESSLNPNNI